MFRSPNLAVPSLFHDPASFNAYGMPEISCPDGRMVVIKGDRFEICPLYAARRGSYDSGKNNLLAAGLLSLESVSAPGRHPFKPSNYKFIALFLITYLTSDKNVRDPDSVDLLYIHS